MIFHLPISIAGQYDWIIQKLPTDFSEINRSSYAIGSIENKKYLAILLDLGTEARFKPALVIARIKKDNTYDPFELVELTSVQGLRLQVKNESIYVQSETANNGTYFRIYQFKRQNDQFRLVGIENQSMVLSERGEDIWRGESINLITSEAIYWAQAFNLEKPSEYVQWEKALVRHRQGLPSTNAQTRKVKLKINSRFYLKDFDLEGFRQDFLCHSFDDKLRFHKHCK